MSIVPELRNPVLPLVPFYSWENCSPEINVPKFTELTYNEFSGKTSSYSLTPSLDVERGVSWKESSLLGLVLATGVSRRLRHYMLEDLTPAASKQFEGDLTPEMIPKVGQPDGPLGCPLRQ